MDRRQKLALLKGIIKGARSIHETLVPLVAVAIEDPETGELTPYAGSGYSTDPAREARNAELLRLAKLDPSIVVIKIVYV